MKNPGFEEAERRVDGLVEEYFFQRSMFISHNSRSCLETSRCTCAVKDFNNYD